MRAHGYLIESIVLAIVVWGAAAMPAKASPVTLRAILIRASQEPAAQDSRLEHVEYKLRRIFGFEYYRFLSESSIVLAVGGEGTLDFGNGHRLRLNMSGGDGSVRVVVRWFRGDDLVLNTTVRVQRRTPVILGGVSDGNGTLIIALTVE